MMFFATASFAQTYKWVRGGGTPQSLTTETSEAVYFMTSDSYGNIYSLSVVGTLPITADTFSRPTGAYGSSKNVLFTSHDCNGQMRFAKLLSSSHTIPLGIVCDEAGHVFVAVDASHNATYATLLRLGYDTTINGNYNNTTMLIQYDTSGALNWFRFIGEDIFSTYTGIGGKYCYLSMDGLDNAHLVVRTRYGVHLSPSLISHTGFYDHSFDASGSLLSINKLDVDTTLHVMGLTIDKQSNKLYAYGYRDMGGFPSMSIYPFLTALDVDRNRIWVDTIANPYYPTSGSFTSITADEAGHLYLTAGAAKGFVYRGDTAINVIGTGVAPVSGILKLDTAGNLLWKRIFSTIVISGVQSVALMPGNKIAASGSIAGTIVSGADTIVSYAGEGNNALFTIVDTAGYIQELQQLHGPGFYDYAYKCASDYRGNLYVAGKVETNIWAGSLTPYSSVGGDSDYFIMKYGVNCDCTGMPVANYTYTGAELMRSFTYTGTTTSIDSVRWFFGDGGTATGFTPSHTYTAAGTYTTCVRIYSSCGNDMHCSEITVACSSLPSASYTDTGNYVHGFIYTGTTTPYYDSVRWSFGDGSFDTGLSVVHSYAVADTYTVCSIIYTHCGNDTSCSEVIITDTTTTLNDISLDINHVRIFPNPAGSEVYVTGVAGHYRLLSIVGAQLQEGVLWSGTNTIPLTSLSPGIYVLDMYDEKGRHQRVRLIKQ